MKLESRLKHYFAALHKTYQQGDAREESFYSSLTDLLEGYAADSRRQSVQITTLPRPTEGGNPDFRIWDGDHRITGYIEAKPPGADLRHIVESDQLRRYLRTFPNLILTDFCEFWLFRDGQEVGRVRIGRPLILTRLGEPPPSENVAEFQGLLDRFFEFTLPKVYTAEELAKALAHRTRFLRDVVLLQLAEEQSTGKGRLLGFFEAFKTYLIGQLDKEQFADLYAQTITYGLFAARTRAGGEFTRRSAVQHVPRTIGILHDVFEFISWGDLPLQLAWIVDDITEVLAVADAGQILDRYYREGKGADPIVHFYETFLAEYDPAERERRGVYYTPEPVVSYIVRSLHELLQNEFGRKEGLAAKGVTLLDPAAGTMTFVARASEVAVAACVKRYGTGAREKFIREQILPNFYGFELMMAPYAVGHLKMGFFLEELGHKLQEGERFRLYLTNTLEMEELQQTNLPGMASLAEESRQAGEVKKETPILVILGNPPYSGHSANKGTWIRGLIDDYKKAAPELNKPGQAKWLQNDYVKFLRFAEWKISQVGHGVVGMITDHSWLGNPTFRGMRSHLLQTFDEIRVLDLHGNSLRRERAPNGSPDENVFDIRQGVAISFLVKRQSSAQEARRNLGPPARVFHAECWGSRQGKYQWLESHDFDSTDWRQLEPRERFFLFHPTDRTVQAAYERFPSVPEIFSLSGDPAPGIVTTHDDFAVSWTAEEARQKVNRLLRTRSESEARELFKLCGQSQWSYERAMRELAEGKWRDELTKILYRPFDVRWTIFNRNVAVHRRERVMRHMLSGENLGLSTTRSIEIGEGFQHVLCSRLPIQHHTVSLKEVNFLFPLYLYDHDPEHGSSHGRLFATQPRSNLNPVLLATARKQYGQDVTPEKVFSYIYAILYTPIYRNTYADSLAIDFPRVPFPADTRAFTAMAEQGDWLVRLHLLESVELDEPLVRFEGSGNSQVAPTRSKGLRYEPGQERVWINPSQYFAPVHEALWEYRIGGYQVLQKWLKDRRGRSLTYEEIETYCRIATALAVTIETQGELDGLYQAVTGNLLELVLAD